MNEVDMEDAVFKARGQKPDKEELGGDFYYRCGYLVCNKIIKRTDNYCPHCGMKIIFED